MNLKELLGRFLPRRRVRTPSETNIIYKKGTRAREDYLKLLVDVRRRDMEFRGMDSDEYRNNRSLSEVSESLGYDLGGFLKAMRQDGQKKATILDIGCGLGNALAEFKVLGKQIGMQVLTTGLTARYLREHKRNVDTALIGMIETKHLPESEYDLVYAAQSVLLDQQTNRCIEKMVNSLRPGGILVIPMHERGDFWMHLKRLEGEEKIALYSHSQSGGALPFMRGPATVAIMRKASAPLRLEE